MSTIKSSARAQTAAAAAAANSVRRAEKWRDGVFRMPCRWGKRPRLSSTKYSRWTAVELNADTLQLLRDEGEEIRFRLTGFPEPKDPNLRLHLSQNHGSGQKDTGRWLAKTPVWPLINSTFKTTNQISSRVPTAAIVYKLAGASCCRKGIHPGGSASLFKSGSWLVRSYTDRLKKTKKNPNYSDCSFSRWLKQEFIRSKSHQLPLLRLKKTQRFTSTPWQTFTFKWVLLFFPPRKKTSPSVRIQWSKFLFLNSVKCAIQYVYKKLCVNQDTPQKLFMLS